MPNCGLQLSAAETTKTSSLWLVGLGLAVFGSFLSVLGLNLQRYSQKKNAALPLEQRKSAFRQPYNLAGVILMALNSLLDLISFGFAPQTLIAPLGAVTLILNLVVAPLILKEKVTTRDIISTFMVFGGVVACVVFSSRDTPVYTYDMLICLFLQDHFIIYASIMSFFLLSNMIFIYNWHRMVEPRKTSWSKVTRFLYPATAGSLGGGSVMFGKAFVELIKSTIVGKNEFIYLGTYVIIACLVACLLLQIRFLNRGLDLFEALFVVPVYQVFWVLVGILGGSIYFDEFENLSALQLIMYGVGVVFSFVGVLLLSTRKQSNAGDKLPNAGTEIAVQIDEATKKINNKIEEKMKEGFEKLRHSIQSSDGSHDPLLPRGRSKSGGALSINTSIGGAAWQTDEEFTPKGPVVTMPGTSHQHYYMSPSMKASWGDSLADAGEPEVPAVPTVTVPTPNQNERGTGSPRASRSSPRSSSPRTQTKDFK